MDMSNRTALVTGGASGIGKAVCIAMAEAGASVVVTDINEEGGKATAAEIAANGKSASFQKLDVTDDKSISAAVEVVSRKHKRLDALVNAAGWDIIQPFMENEPDFWDKIVTLNFMGPVKLTRACLPLLIESEDGRIVNISSDAGRVGSMGETVYAGAKGGVIAFTKSLAREMARNQIKVNCVCPGPTDTPLFAVQPEKMQQALIRAIPLRRVGQPSEVADAVLFFASPRSVFITGQVLSVSGGLTMVD